MSKPVSGCLCPINYASDINLSVGLMIQPLAAGASAEESYKRYTESVAENLTDYEMKSVSGIGTRAVWNTGVKQLTIFDSANMIMVTGGFDNRTEDENLAFSKELASLLMSKLSK